MLSEHPGFWIPLTLMEAGKPFTLRWLTGVDGFNGHIDNIRLEYSPDNGTTYLPIAEAVLNTGSYEWLVPYHASPHCLIRISNADDNNQKKQSFDLLYQFKFRLDEVETLLSNGNDLTVRLGDARNEIIQNSIPSISFIGESNGNEYMSFDDTVVELGLCQEFRRLWHTVQLRLENSNEKVSIILDGKPVLKNIPLSPLSRMYRFYPAVSFVGGIGKTISIDDFSARISIAQEKDWDSLFNEDFERFSDDNQMKESGWVQAVTALKEKTDEAKTVSIAGSFNCTGQTLRIESDEDNETIIVKSFQIPQSFPFDVSDKPFEIRYNNNMDDSIIPISTGHERAEAYSNDIDYNAHGPYVSPITTDTTDIADSNTFGQIQAVTINYIDTYYIYSFDGKLLSEYDQTGSCVRDYIYAGNRLIAEYRPQTSKYYYYMSDQISSTRIITDDSGAVVYSEAYGPYGDVQKTWAKTYDPKQKFSGKEREGYSELDYFGARYFDNNSYRFISVDPVINKEEALSNPQYWNLYAYCGNNPITLNDPDGRLLKFAPGSTKKFITQVQEMKSYLRNSKRASRLLSSLEKNKTTIYIKEINSRDSTCYNYKDKTIYINPYEGFKTTSGFIQSPALGLIHESAHALRSLEEPDNYFNDVRTLLHKDTGYRDMEEFRAITFVESPIARQLGESIRNNQNDGFSVKVKGPTSVIEDK